MDKKEMLLYCITMKMANGWCWKAREIFFDKGLSHKYSCGESGSHCRLGKELFDRNCQVDYKFLRCCEIIEEIDKEEPTLLLECSLLLL
jgi:hypothetical protein